MPERNRDEQEVRLLDSFGERQTIIIDAETLDVLDIHGEPKGMTLAELAQGNDFDLRVRARFDQLNFDATDRPDELPLMTSTVKLKGGEYGVIGQWVVGDKPHIVIAVEIEAVTFKRLFTETGRPYGLSRVHIAGKPLEAMDPSHLPGNAGSAGRNGTHGA
jgi:hypothetical protein